MGRQSVEVGEGWDLVSDGVAVTVPWPPTHFK